MITSFAPAVLDMIPIFTHFKNLFYILVFPVLVFPVLVFPDFYQMSMIVQVWQVTAPPYLKSNMTFIVRWKTLNILVSICAQIE